MQIQNLRTLGRVLLMATLVLWGSPMGLKNDSHI